MQKNTGKMVFLLCNLYVSAVVGAGFATGQEIMRFFTCYGPSGFTGVLLSGVLFMAFGPFLLKKAITYDAYSMGELLSFRLGKKAEVGMKYVNFFLELTVLTVMLAGLRTLLQQIGVPKAIAIVAVSTALFGISFCKKLALRLNNLLTPFVILGVLLTGGILLRLQEGSWLGWKALEGNPTYPWWISALLYVGFNLLLATPALCLAGKTLQQANTAIIIGGGLGGMLICAMALLSQSVLFAFGTEVAGMQMPILNLIQEKLPLLSVFYQGIIAVAMGSSAVICIRCMIELFPHCKKRDNYLVTALLCTLAGLLSLLDFSQLIGGLYPLLGCVGILAVLLILW